MCRLHSNSASNFFRPGERERSAHKQRRSHLAYGHDIAGKFTGIFRTLGDFEHKDYGIPQNRQRLYIVGSRGGSPLIFLTNRPTLPTTGRLCGHERPMYTRTSGSFLARARALQGTLKERGGCFVDILQYRTPERVPLRGFGYATCLLCTSFVWNTSMGRWANEKELLRLQGYPDDYRVVVSKHKFRRQIGNTMSVNVLEAIFARLLAWKRDCRTEGARINPVFATLDEHVLLFFDSLYSTLFLCRLLNCCSGRKKSV